MKSKQLLCLVLVVFMLVIAGCANSGTPVAPSDVVESNPKPTEGTAPSSAPTTPDAAEPIREYPIVTDGSITLTYWVLLQPTAAKYITSYNENTAYQKMQEVTGVNLEFIHPAIGQEKEQFNLLMASNELPDILTMAGTYKGGEFQGMRDGMFLDLTDKLPIYAPDYYESIQSNDEFFREVSDNDGRITAFCAYKPKGDPPHRRIIVREDVLAEIGSEIPKTTDDYEIMFQKMLDAGITPFMLDKTGYEEQFIGLFGIYAQNNQFYKDENEKIQFGQIDPRFKDYLSLMNNWYNKGFISKDFTSVDVNQINTLFDTKMVGTVVGPIVSNYNRAETQGFKVTSVPYPRLKEGDQLHYESTDIWPRQQFEETTAVITKDCKNPEAAIRFMNYGYTQEGADLMNWGTEGVNWDRVDGKRIYNNTMLKNEKFGTEEASYIYKMHFAPKLVYPDTECHANLLKSPGALAIRFKWADDPFIDSIHRLPPFQLDAEDQTRRTEIMTDCNTYTNEMVLKFITGAESLDNFDEFVNMIQSMEINEAIELTQKAYDQYMTKILE